jgi:biopolymer transport protein ExbD
MRLPDEPDIPPQINLIPMIDVVFAILTFFIMSSLFLTKQQGLPVNLPKAANAQQQQIASEAITLTINKKGNISLGDKSIALDKLDEEVRNLIPDNQEELVIINADRDVNHGRVVAVMDRLREIEGVKLAIATENK